MDENQAVIISGDMYMEILDAVDWALKALNLYGYEAHYQQILDLRNRLRSVL